MRLLNFAKATQLLALALLLTILPLSVAAQTTTTNNGGSSQTTQTTSTTETTQQPTSVQVSHSTTQAIDPLWLGVGAGVRETRRRSCMSARLWCGENSGQERSSCRHRWRF